MSKGAHSRPAGDGELLYDSTIPTPTHGERARTLVSTIKTGTLCSIATEPEGFPYGSFVTFALAEGNPIFFFSELAEHTKNLRRDSRASLLVAEAGGEDPLANGRVTLIGKATRLEDAEERAAARAVYLAAHPNATNYVDYADFAFWRLEIESLRYIGGYGRMSWVPAQEWLKAVPDPIAPHAPGIIQHMNGDHADALVEYCRVFSLATDTTAATMVSVDRYGFEMSAETARGRRPIRVAFSRPIETTDDARREMVDLVRKARSQTGSA